MLGYSSGNWIGLRCARTAERAMRGNRWLSSYLIPISCTCRYCRSGNRKIFDSNHVDATNKHSGPMLRLMNLKCTIKGHWQIPFLDHLIKKLEERVSSNAKVAAIGLCLVPSVMSERDDWQTSIEELASLYKAAPLSSTELHCWKRKFMHYQSSKLPDGPIYASVMTSFS